jgi:hypothetical protein
MHRREREKSGERKHKGLRGLERERAKICAGEREGKIRN